MAMEIDTIPEFLTEQRDKAPEDLTHFFIDFEDFWERKLWHELTNKLVEYFKEPQSAPQRIAIYNTFIESFADKINQLQLVTLGLGAATQCPSDEDRLKFLKALADRVNKPASQEAYVYATVHVANTLIKLEEEEDARKKLDECEKVLDNFDSVETVVHAAFYRTNAEYYKNQSDFAAYYKNALLYLACIDLSTLTTQERQRRAVDLSLAALASDSIYNFGELLLHPILDSLTSTQYAWLRELLFAFNRGDLIAYDTLANNVSKHPLLKSNEVFLRQKLCLAALTEAVFRRPPHDRAMTFQTISEETKLPTQDIEFLIMKALALGLVRGTIDQVDGIARINWVQPKVLDMKQIEAMRGRLREWDSSVNHLGNWIEGVGKDVWAA